MDSKYIVNLIAFIIYSILHFSLISKVINEIAGGKNIAVGIFFVIAGVWGLCINHFLLKIVFFEKHHRLINGLLIIFGAMLLVYTLVS